MKAVSLSESAPGIVLPRDGSRRGNRTLYFAVKRGFDVVFSLLMLAVFSPLMLGIFLAVRLTSKGPAVYLHSRVGKNGKPIRILKFRTMVEHADQMIEDFTPEQKREWLENFKLNDDPRLTKIGKYLRKSSLDELPQLINVIRGDLSLVGPRPVVPQELALYGSDGDKLLSIPPGLTGYWQAYARNDCTYPERMRMELSYAEQACLAWDARIILKTAVRVLTCKGAK